MSIAYVPIDFEGRHPLPGGWSPGYEPEVPTLAAIEGLLSADKPSKLRAFTAEWFPLLEFAPTVNESVFEEALRTASDMRALMMLAMEFKRMADEDDCSMESFEKLGVQFFPDESPGCVDATIYYLATSDALVTYVRDTCRCQEAERFFIESMKEHGVDDRQLKEWGYLDVSGAVYCPYVGSYAPGRLVQDEHLHLASQGEYAAGIEREGRYPVFPFSTGLLPEGESLSPKRALLFVDAIMKPFLQGVRMRTVDGVLAPHADTAFTALWVCLSESFQEARISACKACGIPIIAIGERGAKRLYCGDSCKRKYKRALRFAALVNDEGIDAALAAREAGISQATAMRMLERNGIKAIPVSGSPEA